MTDETDKSDDLVDQAAAEDGDAPDVMSSYDYDFDDEEDGLGASQDDALDQPTAGDDEPSVTEDFYITDFEKLRGATVIDNSQRKDRLKG